MDEVKADTPSQTEQTATPKPAENQVNIQQGNLDLVIAHMLVDIRNMHLRIAKSLEGIQEAIVVLAKKTA